MTRVRLKNEHWQVELDPVLGSIFHSCRHKGRPVFRDAVDFDDKFPQTLAGHFPLLPFSNRIANGSFTFAGRDIVLAKNMPGEKHVLHGMGWLSEWGVVGLNESACHLRHCHTPNEWPWAYEANQHISLTQNGLRLELSITNHGDSIMPAGLGFHPFFPNLQNAQIKFLAGGVWLPDEEVLPTEHIKTPSQLDFSRTRSLKDTSLDHCFTDVGDAVISWLDTDLLLQLTSSKNLSRAALYTDHVHDCFCFEPISHTHNALTMPDMEGQGIVRLAPNDTLSCWMEIEVL